jgi:hypothetical protein
MVEYEVGESASVRNVRSDAITLMVYLIDVALSNYIVILTFMRRQDVTHGTMVMDIGQYRPLEPLYECLDI